jgi:hypothetical protein
MDEYFKPPWCRYLWVSKKEYEAIAKIREASQKKREKAMKRPHLKLVKPLTEHK